MSAIRLLLVPLLGLVALTSQRTGNRAALFVWWLREWAFSGKWSGMKRRSFLGLLAAVPALRLLPSAPAAEVAAAPSVPAPGAYAVAVDWAREEVRDRSSFVVFAVNDRRYRAYASEADYLNRCSPVCEWSRVDLHAGRARP